MNVGRNVGSTGTLTIRRRRILRHPVR